ncbi:hypothetical protein Tco_0955633 [Tanacetum coccineum]|uniref:Synaptobrevin, longin-like domain protein n=1 Tax=Tanacetum coccineum TaxID=301880 RepID=A0ABQ5E7R3_9ASTR
MMLKEQSLPTATIFVELERMGYENLTQKLTFYKAYFSSQWKFLIHTILQCLSAKTTSWNEFSSTMASAIICLATNQKFNLSKYIFDNMVKNLDGGVKFLMYPGFVQVFLDKQVEGMSKHKRVYVTPSYAKKVFANMKRPCKGFSGRVTPLFSTMMVQATEDMEPTTEEITPEEHVFTPSYDPPPSGEDRMQLAELISLCTNLQVKVLDLEKAKTAQAKEISSLMKRVKQLEKRRKSITSGLRRLRNVGSSSRVESFNDASLGTQEDASKQGRKIEDLNANAEVTLVNETQEINDDNLMFDTGVLEEQEIKFEKVDEDPVVSVATTTKSIPVSVAEVVTTASASVVILDELTLAQTLIEIKTAKPKPVTTSTTGALVSTASASSAKYKGKAIMDEAKTIQTKTKLQPITMKDFQETPGDLTTRDRLNPKVKVFLIPVMGSHETPGDLTIGDRLSPKVKVFLIPVISRSVQDTIVEHGSDGAGLIVYWFDGFTMLLPVYINAAVGNEPIELEIQEMVNILVLGEAYDKVFNHLDMLHAPLEGKIRSDVRGVSYTSMDPNCSKVSMLSGGALFWRRGVLLLMLTNKGWIDGNGSNPSGGFGKSGGGHETRSGGDGLEGPGGQLSMV